MNEPEFERSSEPLKLHKNLVILVIRQHPEDVAKFLPGWIGTAEEAIAALEADPRQWAHEFNRGQGHA